jgi:Fe-S cluster assembly ATPase SufC
MLEIDDLWVNIDDKEVLKGINLRVPVGETISSLARTAPASPASL